MKENRSNSASAMFEDDDSIWWITGGRNDYQKYLDSTEVFNVNDNSFHFNVTLPKEMAYHNLVNVNNTHMVILEGKDLSDQVFIIDRLIIM